jgi:putative NAD(P)H nitroreductase
MTIRNVSLSCMNILLAAKELWYATCPMLWFNQPSLSDFLELPKEIVPIMIITIWYEDEWKERKKLPLKNLDEVLHFEKFDKYKK